MDNYNLTFHFQMKPTLFRTVLLALVGTLSLALYAQQNLSDTPLPVDEKVRIGKLDNGFTYYIRANHKPEKRVEMRLVVNAGSVLEDEDQRGFV